MLQIFDNSVNPSTHISVSGFKNQIRSIKIITYQYNVVTMTEKVIHNYNQILDLSHTYDDLDLDLYNVLLTGKNDAFNHSIQAEKDKSETFTN